MQNNRSILENLSQALLEKETLNATEVNNIVDGKSYINPDEPGGKPEEIQPEVPLEKLKTKTDPEEGLLGGGGMPDPTPA